ncbi:phosphoenolpyruvate carboxykinase (ATP) [Starkeya koreensis]|uniref:Phosphoenolpyruvate carboxykinase (ATP) n=1 Tax=Ancylobacter koreensis TaxID=266121 RepID=A0ABT0DIY1_9HYPH|nr:phosphoenolpyruvate carboxykinase (ATP) [Ancylobacter koreensis]MCK0207159.1 phosphoenolpyruvate carboxykinase (ATP) [Ancylobacter koreensis]
MNQTGTHNEDHGAEAIGLSGTGRVFWNLREAALCERAVARAEGRLSDTGALVVATVPPPTLDEQDRYVVRDEAVEDGARWEGANPLPRASFETLKADMLAYAGGRTLFGQDLYAGADPVPVRVLTEHAWQALFVRNLLRRPEPSALAGFVPQLTILSTPGFRAEPEKHGVRGTGAVACDLAQGLVLIAGTLHAEEMEAALAAGLAHMPAHSPAERGRLVLSGAASVEEGSTGTTGDLALFLGRSGAGATTLAAGPARTLCADGLLAWGQDGIEPVGAGCHPRTRGLSPDNAPAFHAAARRFGAVLANVGLDPEGRAPDFDDDAPAGEGRAAFPLDFLPGGGAPMAGRPRHVFLLVHDAFGVLPPIARLTPSQALYHFLSGYQGDVTSTESGAEAPQARFAPGGAAIALPTPPSTESRLLRELLARDAPGCWLVNTGWLGSRAGTGRRVPLAVTRRLVEAALSGALDAGETRTDPNFGFAVPVEVEGVERALLDPARAWPTRIDYSMTARRLVGLFTANFARFESAVDEEVRGAQPGVAIAAE